MLTIDQAIRDGPGGHSGHGVQPSGNMEGMSHGGAGGKTPNAAGGMEANPMGKMGGSLADYFLASTYTQSLLKMAVGYLPNVPLLRTVDQPTTAKRSGAKRSQLWFGPFDIATVAVSFASVDTC
jgi:hypothetical protein